MSTSSTDLAIDTGTKLGKIGQAFYFHPDTVARGQELGMKPFQFYGLRARWGSRRRRQFPSCTVPSATSTRP